MIIWRNVTKSTRSVFFILISLVRYDNPNEVRKQIWNDFLISSKQFEPWIMMVMSYDVHITKLGIENRDG